MLTILSTGRTAVIQRELTDQDGAVYAYRTTKGLVLATDAVVYP